jgi:hypothetical protein
MLLNTILGQTAAKFKHFGLLRLIFTSREQTAVQFKILVCSNFLQFDVDDYFALLMSLCSSTDLRGLSILEIDPINCRLMATQHFNTFSSSSAAATDLISYLTLVAKGTVLVGVTAYDAMTSLSSALTALSTIGVPVADVQVKGSFAFVAQKGRNFKTMLKKAVPESLAASLDVLLSG